MTDGEPQYQCEECGEMVAESDAHTKSFPRATLAFCNGCVKQSRSQELGLGR